MVIDVIKSGVYIGWWCLEFKYDCICVCKGLLCFCGYLLSDYVYFMGRSVVVFCIMMVCICKVFVFVLFCFEEVGEFWLLCCFGYDLNFWWVRCKCKYIYKEYYFIGLRRCKCRGCGCLRFFLNFLCVVCDWYWEEYEMFFEILVMRKDVGVLYGEVYLFFYEILELRVMVLIGKLVDER